MSLPSTSGGTVESAATTSDVKKPTKKICCACPETKVWFSQGRFWVCSLVMGSGGGEEGGHALVDSEWRFSKISLSVFVFAEGKRRVHCTAGPRIRTVQIFDRSSQGVPAEGRLHSEFLVELKGIVFLYATLKLPPVELLFCRSTEHSLINWLNINWLIPSSIPWTSRLAEYKGTVWISS